MVKYLLIISFLISINAISCSTWLCTELNIGICATSSNSVVYVNTHYCSANQVCYLQSVTSSNNTDSTLCTDKHSIINGLVIDYSLIVTSINPDYCMKQPFKDLDEGFHPKECISDADCMLKDGTLSSCACGFSKSYCRPDWSSSYFDEWLSVCTQKQKISKHFEDFYNVYLYYPYLVSMHYVEGDCITKAFEDLWILEEIFQDVTHKEYFLTKESNSEYFNTSYRVFTYIVAILILIIL